MSMEKSKPQASVLPRSLLNEWRRHITLISVPGPGPDSSRRMELSIRAIHHVLATPQNTRVATSAWNPSNYSMFQCDAQNHHPNVNVREIFESSCPPPHPSPHEGKLFFFQVQTVLHHNCTIEMTLYDEQGTVPSLGLASPRGDDPSFTSTITFPSK
jgi:hypothetical protein